MGRWTERNCMGDSMFSKGQIDLKISSCISAQECQGSVVRRTAGETEERTSEKTQCHTEVRATSV